MAEPILIRQLKQLRPMGDKTQMVRLLDVFVFGPLMIGAAKDQQSPYFKGALIAIGVGTIVYNAVNYLTEASAARAGDAVTGDTVTGDAALQGLRAPLHSASHDAGLGCGRYGTSDLAWPCRGLGRRPCVYCK